MKPITNILLVLALICYVFLPLLDVQFTGSVTGLSYTAGTIAAHLGLRSAAVAVIPFVAFFIAIGLNSLKNRRWAIGTVVCILLVLWFFYHTAHLERMPLTHQPGVNPGEDLGQGFEVLGLGLGHHIASSVSLLALFSAILSMIPWHVNTVIERAVDQTTRRGIEDVREWGTRMSHDVHQWRKDKSNLVVKPHTSDDAPPAADDHSRFMPK